MEIESYELGSDELLLHDRLQVETALSVLALAGMNPDARAQLRTFLDAHDKCTQAGNGPESELSVYLNGPAVPQMKEDIILAATLAAQDKSLGPTSRMAADGLLVAIRATSRP